MKLKLIEKNKKWIRLTIVLILTLVSIQPLITQVVGDTTHVSPDESDKEQTDDLLTDDKETKSEANDCGCNPSKPNKLVDARAILYPYLLRILLFNFDNEVKIGRSSEIPGASISPDNQEEIQPCIGGSCTTLRVFHVNDYDIVFAKLIGGNCSGYNEEEEIEIAIQQALEKFKEHFNEVNEGFCGDFPCECLCPNPNPFLCYKQTILNNEDEANLMKPLGPGCEVRIILTVRYDAYKFEGECGKLSEHPDWSRFPTDV
jgi:hypothetical protein